MTTEHSAYYGTCVSILSHRKEAFHTGEFGMLGFQNANYWSNAFLQAASSSSSPSSDNPNFPHASLRQAVQTIATSHPQYQQYAPIQNWCRTHGFENNNNNKSKPDRDHDDSNLFDPRPIHELCATVLRQQQDGRSADAILQAFAEQIATAEIRILLHHTLPLAGYDPPSVAADIDKNITPGDDGNASDQSTMVIDPDLAKAATRKISSAHLDGFRTNGSIVLRRMLTLMSSGSEDDDDNNNSNQQQAQTHLDSLAAGVACRLLEAPACRVWRRSATAAAENRDTTTMIQVVVVTSKGTDVDSWAAQSTILASGGGGGDFGVGDMLAIRQSSSSSSFKDESPAGTHVYQFVACSVDDPSATWVDPFHGTRGDTPTTVIQWSKGTIF